MKYCNMQYMRNVKDLVISVFFCEDINYKHTSFLFPSVIIFTGATRALIEKII